MREFALFKMSVVGAVPLLLAGLLSGCVTKADLDMVAARNPIACDVNKSTRETMKFPLDAEKLYGKWEGGDEFQEIIWKHDGWWKKFDRRILRYTYEFFQDGTYIYESYENGIVRTSMTNKWEYVINEYNVADITLYGLELTYRSVFWISENEMVIAPFRTADQAVKWWFYDGLVKNNYPESSWNSWCSFSRDNNLNMCWVTYHISGDDTEGYKRERHQSASVMKRTKAASGLSPLQQANQTKRNPDAVAPASNEPIYRILYCARESDNDFAYEFALELTDKSGSSLQAFRAVQQEFREAVKADYAESFPGVKRDSLYVEFSKYRLNEGKIEGRAVVLTISVTSLAYDPNTRMGKLAVKVNANQFEEARKWVRKNIETLATDKNIVLTSGERPAPGRFTLGREEFNKESNILEIEFQTE